MREYSEFTGEDFEAFWIGYGFTTKSGALDRNWVGSLLGVCKRAVGYMMEGRITRQTYNQLELIDWILSNIPEEFEKWVEMNKKHQKAA